MADDIDREAFSEMQHATADKTAVNLMGDKSRVTKEDVHNMLMVAGMTPAIGNVADAADALLYTLEGEFGSAALSTAAMIPFVGQFVSAKKAAKIVNKIPKKFKKRWESVYERGHPKGRISKTLEIEGKEVGYVTGNRFISKFTKGNLRICIFKRMATESKNCSQSLG